MNNAKLIAPLLLVAFLLPLQACALSGDAIEGQVLEEGTNKPIEGAIVVVRWSAAKFAFVESRAGCVHVNTATTDAKGRYRFPAWSKSSEGAFITDMAPIVSAYKVGYTQPLFEGPTLVHLKPFSGSRGERLEYLERIEYAARCSNPGESERNMLPFYRALHEEAKSLVVTKDDQRIADGFLSDIEIIEFGRDVGMKRAIERAEKRKKQP